MHGRFVSPGVLLLILALTSSLAAAASEAEMAQRIDALLATRWEQEGVSPAPLSSDAEFLRRASLDLTGAIPTVQEVTQFLSDDSPDKRRRLIDRLLTEKPTHSTHFANLWTAALLPSDVDLRRLGGGGGFQTWLRNQFADNTPYDKLVSDVLLARGNANQLSPALFYTALELKPEELAASTSRIFLGVQIQCAQCHDHPFDHWKRSDFWGYAAFFARLQQPQNRNQAVAFTVADASEGEVKLPDTDQVIAPRFLGGPESDDQQALSRRVRLATWLTSRQNPYFSRAAVNRVWGVLFGRGLVEPVDDLGKHNPPSHEQLLKELSEYFAGTKFDLRRLVLMLTQTQAYQLSSKVTSETAQRPELFATMAVKSLTANQLYDCLQEAMRRRESQPQGGQSRLINRRQFDVSRQTFLSRFEAPTQGATEYQAGIPQALTLMNGSLVAEATDLQRSDILAALDAPFFSDEQRVETLFLSTVSRYPSDQERGQFIGHVESASSEQERRRALSDVLWALLNSAEFSFNH